MTRTILHLDLDAFFCAVEEGLNPKLRGQTFAVGGKADARGVVASCSYPARRMGVHSAMPMSQAVRLCPGLIVVPPHFKEYSTASHKVMALLGEITPLLEQISIDEAFMDVTPQAGEALARRLQRQINEELHLPCSFGVATNKLVAKIANNVGKDRAKAHPDAANTTPNAITVVLPGTEAAFLAPLGIRELWGVGPKTAERMRGLGIRTIGDLARWNDSDLVYMFGKNGGEMAQRARGLDDRPVAPEQDTKSISRETTFTRDVNDMTLLRQTIRQLAEGVGWRTRKAALRGNTIRVKIRWSDFTTLTRQQALAQATDDDAVIEGIAQDLFRAAWTPGQAVRLIGVGISGFDDAEQQLALWQDEASEEKRKLQETLDDLRSRFGESIVKRGSDLNGRKKS
ncbi:MAG: DNA polymerase IV [Chloroflexota bacterium]